MINSPLVSVIIPVYNGERFLAEAVESVLNQSYLPIELIVVDDGSTDRTKDIALSYPSTIYLYQKNSGHAAAKNRGLKIAKGEYIAFLDADDIWLSNKISIQISAFIANPKLDIVTGLVEEFYSPEIGTSHKNGNKIIAGYTHIAMLVNKSVFDKVGYFHEDIRVGEIVSWFSLVLEQGLNVDVLPKVVAKRRIHRNNISIKMKSEKNKALIEILKKSLDRKRIQNKDGE